MVDTRPAAQRWRGSAVCQPQAQPLAHKSIDVGALSPIAERTRREGAAGVPGFLAALAAIAALTRHALRAGPGRPRLPRRSCRNLRRAVNMNNKTKGLATRVGQHVRQGDVLIIRRLRAPEQLVELPRENGGVVLAHGEHTGHSHQFRGPQVAIFHDDRGHAFVRVQERPDMLVHEEHTAHAVSVGDFELAVQVEYEPTAMRVVAD
jgi:hypothetical protein